MFTIDKIKLAAAVLIVAIGIGAFYYFGDQSGLSRGLILLGAATTAIMLAMFSTPGQAAWGFSRESYRELQKVVWPTRKETLQMTLVVIVIVLVAALFLWIVDWGLLKIVKAVTGQRS